MQSAELSNRKLSMKFVIQEHRAGDRIRYYLRLEKDGVLKSWAVPKGLPEEWGEQRLAMQVGDGDLSLIEFEGKVQKGRYGPGEIMTWDSGRCECHKWSDERIIFTLNGSRVRGAYALVIFPKGGDKSWLLGQTKARVETPPIKPSTESTPAKLHAQPSTKKPSTKTIISEPKTPWSEYLVPPEPNPRPKASAKKTTARSPLIKTRTKPSKSRHVSSKARPKKFSSGSLRKRSASYKVSRWFDSRRYSKEGRLLSFMVIGIFIAIIYGLIKLIQNITSSP